MSADAMRTHLRMSTQDEYSLLEAYIHSVQEIIEDHCRISLALTKWRLTLPGFPGCIDQSAATHSTDSDGNSSGIAGGFASYLSSAGIILPVSNVKSVALVEYRDSWETTDTLDDTYTVGQKPAILLRDSSWPSAIRKHNAVTVEFWAGDVNPLTLNDSAPFFTSESGYQYSDGDVVVLSSSGNTNEILGDTAGVPENLSERGQYYVTNVSGDGLSFDLEATVGGGAITPELPPGGNWAGTWELTETGDKHIDRLYDGVLSPHTLLVLRSLVSEAWTNRCLPESDVHVLRRLKWESPA